MSLQNIGKIVCDFKNKIPNLLTTGTNSKPSSSSSPSPDTDYTSLCGTQVKPNTNIITDLKTSTHTLTLSPSSKGKKEVLIEGLLNEINTQEFRSFDRHTRWNTVTDIMNS